MVDLILTTKKQNEMEHQALQRAGAWSKYTSSSLVALAGKRERSDIESLMKVPPITLFQSIRSPWYVGGDDDHRRS
ncbi:unnamed protein product [Macrosiphum euphorbiae]|uniref:Uncharacterized protein n=1 Tax=Macrosiphum euphorbiae TaxID=13131 RepID=A0AAV0WWE2_9HEMI|nr:unnamed protein product [Macrosiphum euphorbiae]